MLHSRGGFSRFANRPDCTEWCFGVWTVHRLIIPVILESSMPYSAEISRVNPSCFLFLIDQSGSMSDPFGGQPGKKKSEGVADAINRLLQNLVIKCAKSEGVRDYYHVGVIGYGSQVAPALGGALAGRDLVPISEIADKPLRIEQRVKKVDDGAGGLADQTIKFPVWFEPVAGGGTPMREALELARQTISDFTSRYPNCYPPIVINITDGAANEDPESASAALRSLASTDGPVLLFNAHVSERPDRPIEFPSSESQLPDDYARLLFRMSSTLPAPMLETARREELLVADDARGFVFNADLVAVIRFLDIGTKVAQNLR